VTSELPKGYEVDYMIFLVADGKLKHRKYIEEHYTFLDAIEWLQLRSYEGYVTKKIMKKQSGRQHR